MEYWDERPCNVRHSWHSPGSVEWSEGVRGRKYYVEPHIPGFAEFGRWRGKKVLEIGCGIGTDTAEFVKAGALVDAVDSSGKSIELARTRSDADFHVMDAQLELPGGRYDLVYSFGVLHHIPFPDIVLKRARKVIAADGELRIMVYAGWSLKFLLGQQPEAQANCPYVRTYSARQVRRLLKSCGFRAVSVSKAHIFPWKVNEYVQYRYVKHWIWRIIPHGWFEKLLGHHLLIVAKPE